MCRKQNLSVFRTDSQQKLVSTYHEGASSGGWVTVIWENEQKLNSSCAYKIDAIYYQYIIWLICNQMSFHTGSKMPSHPTTVPCPTPTLLILVYLFFYFRLRGCVLCLSIQWLTGSACHIFQITNLKNISEIYFMKLILTE